MINLPASDRVLEYFNSLDFEQYENDVEPNDRNLLMGETFRNRHEKFLSSFIESFPFMVLTHDLNRDSGRVIYVNNAVEKLVGYTVDEFIKGDFSFIAANCHPGDFEENKGILFEEYKKIKNMSDGEAENHVIELTIRFKHKS